MCPKNSFCFRSTENTGVFDGRRPEAESANNVQREHGNSGPSNNGTTTLAWEASALSHGTDDLSVRSSLLKYTPNKSSTSNNNFAYNPYDQIKNTET